MTNYYIGVGLNQKQLNMKLNKMTLIAALALGGLLTLGTAANAQDATTNTPAATPPPMRPRQPGIDQLAKILALTDEQKTNVQAVLKDQRQQMGDLRKDTTLTQEDRRAKMKDIRDATTAKMKDILTPEQFAKYQRMMPQGRRPGLPAPTVTPAPMTPPTTN